MSGMSDRPVPDFGAEMRRYAAAGFLEHILPIIPPDAKISPAAGKGIPGSRGKVPGRRAPDGSWTGYTKWPALKATEDHIATWATWGCGFGLQCSATPAIDIDVTDRAFADRVEELAVKYLGTAPVRYGNRPKRLLVYRCANPDGALRKRRFAFTLPGSDEKQAVEFLGRGQQFVACGFHPKTGMPYEFENGMDPASVGLEGLTGITGSDVDRFFEALVAMIRDAGGTVVSGTSRREARGTKGDNDATAPTRRSLADPELKAPDDDMLIRAVQGLPNDYDRETWIKLTAAIKAAANDVDRVYAEAYKPWCLKYQKNTEQVARATWESIHDSHVGAAYILQEAIRRAGFPDDGPVGPPAPMGAPGRLQIAGLQPHLATGSDVEIARQIATTLKQCFGDDIVHAEGAFWCWNLRHWSRMDTTAIRLRVHQWDGRRCGKDGRVRLNDARIRSIIKVLETILAADRFFEMPAAGIPVLDGFVVVDDDGSVTLREHDPAHRNRHVIEAAYDPSNFPWSVTDRDLLLLELLDGCFRDDPDIGDKIELIAQMLGVAAAGAANRVADPKAFVLLGRSAANGKSAVLDMFRALVPPNAQASVPLAEFKNDAARIGLVGKTLNAVDELSGIGSVAADHFKKIVTGDVTSARDLYKSRVEFRPGALHLFATNTTPRFTGGMDNGVLRRLQVLPFNRTIPPEERIRDIGLRIAENELDYLLALAVYGLRRLARNGWRYHTFVESEEAVREWNQEVDIVAAWYDQADITVHNDGSAKMPTRKVYEDFRAYANANGRDRSRLPGQVKVTQYLRAQQVPLRKSNGETVAWMSIGRSSTVDFERDDDPE